MRKCALLVALIALSPACVIGRQTRPSRNESAQGPSGAPVSGSPVVAQVSPDNSEAPSPAKPPKPGSEWHKGYWHWDGVRYVWERGHWQDSPAPVN
ncbi:MAG: YXWGXW repeat-containing protein [Polyangiaceae bacterium]